MELDVAVKSIFSQLNKTFTISKEIIQLNSIEHIFDFFESNSVVFLDLDETIIIPKTNFIFGTKKTEKFIKDIQYKYSKTTLELIFQKMEEEYYNSSVIPVESFITLKFLKHLQNNNIKIFGLTARSYHSVHTRKLLSNLKELGIHFSQIQSNFEDEKVVFHNGIFFANETNKGEVIKKFFEEYSDFQPSKIYFLDDQLKNCKDVKETLSHFTIPFITIHYQAAERNISEEGMLEQFQKIIKSIKI